MTRHPAGAVCAKKRSVAQVATCEVVPSVLCILRAWKEAQTSTPSGRASARARGRDVTSAPVQIIAWESATKQRASANVTCNTMLQKK